MKRAKILSLLTAIVLAFVFIGSPAVFSAGGSDEHPWDEEYVASGEQNNSYNGTAGEGDTTIFVDDPLYTSGEGEWSPFFDWFWDNLDYMMYLQFLTSFGDLPSAGQSGTIEDGVIDSQSSAGAPAK